MKAVLKRELLLNIKSMLIWSLSVGILGLTCILLYSSMEGEMKDMADAFSNMGAFSDAFGMSTLSIASLKGYFATEIGAVHGLGSGMFAAIIAINIISKEEDGHTGEFIFSMPLSRTTFMCRQFVMNMEVAGICFGLSSLAGKNRMGLGLGLALLFYAYDVMGRVIPDLKDYLFVGPYSYANAAEIFTGEDTPVKALILAVLILVIGVAFGFYNFNRRDLAS